MKTRLFFIADIQSWEKGNEGMFKNLPPKSVGSANANVGADYIYAVLTISLNRDHVRNTRLVGFYLHSLSISDF